MRKSFFAQRVVTVWNVLPGRVVEAGCLTSFKKYLDEYFEIRTRGHGLKIRGSRFRTELRRNYFTQRVVNLWNSLPSEAVETTSLNVFKARIDKVLNSKRIRIMVSRRVSGAESTKRPAMILLNGGAGSRGQMAYSCSQFLCSLLHP